jgi:cytochrome P450
LGFFAQCAGEYGDVAAFRLAGWRAVLLNHPDLTEYVLVKNHQNFVKHRFFWRHVTAIFGRGLLTSEGQLWQRQRKLAAPAFSGSRLDRYAITMVNQADALCRTWRSGDVIDIHRAVMGLTLKIAAKTLFGADTDDEAAAIHDRFEDVLAEISARFRRPFRIPDAIPIPGNIRYRRGVARIDDLVSRIIAERRQSCGGHEDLLSTLMTARDEAGQPMSTRQIRDEVITFLLAGHETTALALSWTWYLLGRHPKIDLQLAEEIQTVLKGRLPTTDDLPALRFTEQVVSESLRLYPPAYALGREALVSCEIGGYRIAAGTTIFMSPWVTQRDPRWFDDPLEFRPARWDNGFAKRLPRLSYMPFGGGPRICIGNRFAIMEAVLILATVAQHYRLELISDKPIEPSPSITLRPKGCVRVKLVPR